MNLAPQIPAMSFGMGTPESVLNVDEIRAVMERVLDAVPRGSRVLAIIPDKTRDDNTHILFPNASDILEHRGIKSLDILVAQGTHPPMTETEKLAKIGLTRHSKISALGGFYDHRWNDPSELISIGELSSDQVTNLTNGIFVHAIPLEVNRLVAPGRHDVILIFGATVPHEVAGFAGGAKYFFPGIAGANLTHKTHWLSALTTIEKIIGRIETPTRHLIEAAADHISTPVIAFTSVVTRTDDDSLRTHALFGGDFRSSLRQAAEVSRHVHIKYTGRKYHRVIALLDDHYEDLWLGGKASYRLGAVVEAGGELIIYAPHLRCVSVTHGAEIERFGGYAPIETIKDLVAKSGEMQSNLCVAAHLAHVSYAGRSDGNGKFVPRYHIILASEVDRKTCRRINLDYLDHRDFKIDNYRNDPNTLVVERAGRDLYLVEPASN